MDCSCSVDIDYDFGPDFIKSRVQVAKKEYDCLECGALIKSGERYEYVFGSWDSNTSTHRTCLDCVSLRDTFFNSWAYGEVLGDLIEYLDDVYYEVPESCIAGLTPKARAWVCNEIEDYWETED